MALHAILFSRCIYAMDDSVEACLHHRSLSAKNCSRRHHAQAMPRSCLTAHIPAWRQGVDFLRVACCFRSCLLHWIDRLDLRANAAHWASRGTNHFVANGAGGCSSVRACHARTMPLDWVLNTRFAVSHLCSAPDPPSLITSFCSTHATQSSYVRSTKLS